MRKATVGIAVLALSLLLGVNLILAEEGDSEDGGPQVLCDYGLTAATGQPGTANVKIKDGGVLKIQFLNTNANTLYTVWVDFRNRALLAAGEDPFPDYPDGAIARGVAPAFATTAGVKEGMGVDPNGLITNNGGNGIFEVQLDYALLDSGDSPVVFEDLDMQGQNRVGGHWMRVYPVDPELQPSLQSTDPVTGLPLVERGTAQGLTIVRHADLITHGHTPGVGGEDHLPAFHGDFPSDCSS